MIVMFDFILQALRHVFCKPHYTIVPQRHK
jgi:hypothetical protein